MAMKPLTITLTVTLLSLQFALWAGDKNVPDLLRLQESIEDTRAVKEGYSQRNQKLLAEVIDLKQGGETVETLARSELGLIKPEETFYQIVE